MNTKQTRMMHPPTIDDLRWLPGSEPTQDQSSGPEWMRPAATSDSAKAAREALRITVDRPTGAEWSWPKQLQSGLRPRHIAKPAATMKMTSKPRAAQEAYQASFAGIRAKARINSKAGNNTATGRASTRGTPNSGRTFRKPSRLTSLVAPARRNTAARTKRRARNRSSTLFRVLILLQRYDRTILRELHSLIPGVA